MTKKLQPSVGKTLVLCLPRSRCSHYHHYHQHHTTPTTTIITTSSTTSTTKPSPRLPAPAPPLPPPRTFGVLSLPIGGRHLSRYSDPLLSSDVSRKCSAGTVMNGYLTCCARRQRGKDPGGAGEVYSRGVVCVGTPSGSRGQRRRRQKKKKATQQYVVYTPDSYKINHLENCVCVLSSQQTVPGTQRRPAHTLCPC